jgi:ribonuclease HI
VNGSVDDLRLPGFEAPAKRTLRIYCDGGSRGNPGPAAVGAVVLDTAEQPPRLVATVSETIGVATNNVAEYTALIRGLEAAAPFGADRMEVRADSQLLIRQLEGRYRVKHPSLVPLHREARRLLGAYAEVELLHVRREDNTEADALVNAALDASG